MTYVPINLKGTLEKYLKGYYAGISESALRNLCSSYSGETGKYLDLSENLINESSDSFAIQWYLLALIDKEYPNKQENLDKLISYTSADYNFNTRMEAFEILKKFKVVNDKVLFNLEDAYAHYNWRLKKFAKAYLTSITPQLTK